MSEDINSRTRLERAMRRPATVREIVLVLGVPMALSLAPVIRLALGRPMVTVFTDRNLLISLAIQAIIAACLLAYLSTRHWRPLDVAGTPELQDLGRGLALWLALIGIFYLVMLSLYTISPGIIAALRAHRFTGVISPPVVVAGAVLDPIFEEFLWLGYSVPALANLFGIRAAFVGSVLLRVAAHAYQGALGLIAILPVAVVLTLYFVRTGRLWPVIVAHVIQDAIALSLLKGTV